MNPDSFRGATRGLTVGTRTFINYGCFFDLGAETVIGDDCNIGYQAMFITCSHKLGDNWSRAGEATAEPIRVGAGTCIGARAIIMPGVTIGPGCIIAAGSAVTLDCEPDSMYAGASAEVKKSFDSNVARQQPGRSRF